MSIDKYDVGRMAEFGETKDIASALSEVVGERDAAHAKIVQLETRIAELEAKLAAGGRLAEAQVAYRKARSNLHAAKWGADDPVFLDLIDAEGDASIDLYNARRDFLTAYTQTPPKAEEQNDE